MSFPQLSFKLSTFGYELRAFTPYFLEFSHISKFQPIHSSFLEVRRSCCPKLTQCCMSTKSMSESNDEKNSREMNQILSSTPTIGGTLQRAIQVLQFAGPKKFLDHVTIVANKPKPKPLAGEVVVRMRLRSLNPADGLSLMGLYGGFQPEKFPATPGLEGMGQIDAVGPGVSEFKVGQRVVPLLRTNSSIGEGSWQEYCKVAASDIIAIPDSISDETAAQLVVNPITAYGILKDLNPPQGSYVIQSAAGSVLGRIIIALSKHWGFKTINIVRRSEQKEELIAIGADEVICSKDEDVISRVNEITAGKLCWGGIDSVAGEMTKTVVKCTRSEGVVFVLGGMSSPDSAVFIPDLIFRGVSLHGWWLTRYLGKKTEEEKKRVFEDIVSLMDSKVIEPFTGEKFDLADFRLALKKQQELGRGGKLLLSG